MQLVAVDAAYGRRLPLCEVLADRCDRWDACFFLCLAHGPPSLLQRVTRNLGDDYVVTSLPFAVIQNIRYREGNVPSTERLQGNVLSRKSSIRAERYDFQEGIANLPDSMAAI